MKNRKLDSAIIVSILSIMINCSGGSEIIDSDNAYLGQTIPGDIPVLYAEGLISTDVNEYTPSFSPDGKEMFFTRDVPQCAIMYTEFKNGTWTVPEITQFSGDYVDADPFVAPDGRSLYFGSNRPLGGGNEKKSDYDFWKVEKTPNGWIEAKNIGNSINSPEFELFSTISANNNLYWGTIIPGEGFGGEDIYFSRFSDGKYSKPENLGPAINTSTYELEPYIAPDETYLIFVSGGREDTIGDSDLYISFKLPSGEWSEAVNCGDKINTIGLEQAPVVSPDGKFLFFTGKRGDRESKDIYWVSTEFISKLKQEMK